MATMPDLVVKVRVEEDDGQEEGSGIGLLILGAFMIWVWGAVVGVFFSWLIFKH